MTTFVWTMLIINSLAFIVSWVDYFANFDKKTETQKISIPISLVLTLGIMLWAILLLLK